ncbi:exopolysaccharide biosynthesis protein [Neobacillus drentensis]|uniref:exopolysaccharide biosynthesis protein n=1 Tax=Neobacillus drentensis TaxID=220684 RepID=UPI003B586144
MLKHFKKQKKNRGEKPLLYCVTMLPCLLISAPGASLSAGVPGSLLGASLLRGLPSPVLPQESRAFRSNQHG